MKKTINYILAGMFSILTFQSTANAVPVAVGYDFEVTGASFASILPITDAGNGIYDLWLFDGDLNDYVDSGFDVMTSSFFVFDPAVTRFSLRGIEADAMLDPDDPFAFILGMTFLDDDNDPATSVQIAQTPIIADYTPPGVNVPEPSSIALLAIGLLGLGFRKNFSA